MQLSRIYDNTYPPYLYLKLNSGKEFRIWANHTRDFGIMERSKYEYAMSQKKSLRTIVAYIESLAAPEEKTKTIINQLVGRLQQLGETAARLRDRVLNWKDYDLWKEIEKHTWKKSGQPSKKALEWYKKYAIKDSEFWHKYKMLRQGFLYIFHYDTPKYGDILDFFDTEPLVISFGKTETSLGDRDIGVNLHLMPRKLRAIIMYKIFELNRNYFKEQLFKTKQKPVPITWEQIKKPLEKYGIGFAIRMYIPELRKQTLEFPFENWKDAIYIESKGYSKKTIEQIEELWREFVRKSNIKGLNESWQKS